MSLARKLVELVNNSILVLKKAILWTVWLICNKQNGIDIDQIHKYIHVQLTFLAPVGVSLHLPSLLSQYSDSAGCRDQLNITIIHTNVVDHITLQISLVFERSSSVFFSLLF